MEDSSKSFDRIEPVSFGGLIAVFLKKLVFFARQLILFVFTHKIFLLICFLFGVGLGITWNSITIPTYKLTMLVRSTELNGRTFNLLLESLNQLVVTGSRDELSRNLRVSPELAGQIRYISARNLEGDDLKKDTSKNMDRPISIDVVVSDNRYADTLQKTLLGYFNNNDYLSKIKMDKIAIMEERLRFLNAELNRLDSLKLVYNKFMESGAKGGSMFYNNAFNPADLYVQSRTYFAERLTVQNWLNEQGKPVIQIDNFKPTISSTKGNIYVHALSISFIMFLLGCLVILVREVIKDGVTTSRR